MSRGSRRSVHAVHKSAAHHPRRLGLKHPHKGHKGPHKHAAHPVHRHTTKKH